MTTLIDLTANPLTLPVTVPYLSIMSYRPAQCHS